MIGTCLLGATKSGNFASNKVDRSDVGEYAVQVSMKSFQCFRTKTCFGTMHVFSFTYVDFPDNTRTLLDGVSGMVDKAPYALFDSLVGLV